MLMLTFSIVLKLSTLYSHLHLLPSVSGPDLSAATHHPQANIAERRRNQERNRRRTIDETFELTLRLGVDARKGDQVGRVALYICPFQGCWGNATGEVLSDTDFCNLGLFVSQ